MKHIVSRPVLGIGSARQSSLGSFENRRIRALGGTSVLTLTAALGMPMMASAQAISEDLTAPVASSTVDNGAPGDVTITEDGSITLTEQDGSTAVTMDSDNAFNNDGEITINDSDNATGVRILADQAGNITHNGTLSVIEDYTREDDDDDGDVDGPLAIGVGRTGILFEPGGTHAGTLTTGGSSSIEVEGNQSFGINVASFLDGSASLDGSVSVLGDDARGVVFEQGASGDVLLSGDVSAIGENAVAAEITGDIGGALTVESALQSTGFVSTTQSNYVAFGQTTDDTLPLEERLDAEALLPNTAGMIVSGNVANGLLINGAVDDFITQEDLDDETKDTVDDFDENRVRGSINSIGSGPALLITPGTAAGDLTFGTVVETVRDTLDDDEDEDTTETLAVFNYEFGLINRGTISGDGQNVGFDAEGVRIEGDPGSGRTVTITGGIQNRGTMRATAFEADATALSLQAGTDISRLVNNGLIEATTFTVDGDSAIAVDIADGADITSITNFASISALSVGESGNATAILDRGGQITDITNTGTLSATLSDTAQDVATPGNLLAIDLSAHGVGADVQFVQQREDVMEDRNNDDVIDENDARTPLLEGDVWFGAGNETFDVLAGSVNGDIDFGTGNVAFTMDDADMTGDITVRSGTHDLAFADADVDGTLSFIDSTGMLAFTSGSTFDGVISTTNSLVDLMAADSQLQFDDETQSSLSSLDVSGTSELIFDIDPFTPIGSVLDVAGTAQIGEDVTVTPVLQAFTDQTFTQSLITADTINFAGGLSEVGLTQVPFIYNAELSVIDDTRDELQLSFTVKTAEQLGFDTNQSAAYTPLLSVFAADADLGSAISTLTEEADFDEAFNLLLPQRTNASTQYLVSQSNASFGALADRFDVLAFGDGQSRGIWVQEHFAVVDQDDTLDSPGFNGDGLGFSIGADRRLLGLDNVGLMLTYSSGEFEEKTGGRNPVRSAQLGVGAYIQEKIGPISLRAAGQVASLDFSSDREVFIDDLFYDISGEWSGTSQAASLGASSQWDTGFVYVRPEITVDWYSLSQDGYTETGGGGLLEAEIGDADTGRTSTSALVTFGRAVNIGIAELNVEATGGYMNVLSSDPFETSVRYLGTDETFILVAPEDPDSAALFGLSVSSIGAFAKLRFGYDLESNDLGATHYVGASLRVAF